MPDTANSTKQESGHRKSVPEDGIGERIRSAREARQWTQAILANRTKINDLNKEGISRTVLVGYESGKTKPGARELRLLSETLHVTPNWLLYGTEKPLSASLPSLEFFQGNDELENSLRISLALCLLKPHERDLIGTMLLSLAGRELGDAQLSGLMTMARMFYKEIADSLKKDLGTNSVGEAVRVLAEGSSSNWGNKLHFNDDGEVISGEVIYPDPRKQ
jgi:transcriptional regulator with XRE-family HTH domain